jgi:hypothetical protein
VVVLAGLVEEARLRARREVAPAISFEHAMAACSSRRR